MCLVSSVRPSVSALLCSLLHSVKPCPWLLTYGWTERHRWTDPTKSIISLLERRSEEKKVVGEGPTPRLLMADLFNPHRAPFLIVLFNLTIADWGLFWPRNTLTTNNVFIDPIFSYFCRENEIFGVKKDPTLWLTHVFLLSYIVRVRKN